MHKCVLLGLAFFCSGSFALAATISLGDLIDVTDFGTDFVPTAGNTQNEYVGYLKSTDQAAIRRANGTIEPIGTLTGGTTSRATEINADGTQIAGWSTTASGNKDAFRRVGPFMTNITNSSGTNNEAVGFDGAGNIVLNRELVGTQRIQRWNVFDGSIDNLLDSVQATGVNLNRTISGVNDLGSGIYFDGSSNTITPGGYSPSAGISDADLTGGQLNGSLAAFFRIGDANAQFIPNIFTLGADSEVTGLTDMDNLFGNTDSTVFAYSLSDSVLYDLNNDFSFTGSGSLANISEILGAVTDSSDTFFGKYTDLEGMEHSFSGSFVTQVSTGDFDEDGDVDGADFLKWQREEGTTAGLAAWEDDYGSGTQPVRAIQVPEPTALALVLLAGIGSPYCRRRTAK